VQAIIAGNKTQFREVIKCQPNRILGEGGSIERPLFSNLFFWRSRAGCSIFNFGECPYKLGQKIFCKESFCEASSYKGITLQKETQIEYKADGGCLVGNWKPAQHISRLTLQIKEIRVERLAEISEEDARKEGVIDGGCGNCGESEFVCKCSNKQPLPREDFIFNWNANHKKPEEKFGDNPWVWVVNFEVVK